MRLDYNKSRKFTLKPPGLVLEDMGRLTQRRNVPSFTFLGCTVHSCNTQTMKCTKLKVQLEGLFHVFTCTTSPASSWKGTPTHKALSRPSPLLWPLLPPSHALGLHEVTPCVSVKDPCHQVGCSPMTCVVPVTEP